MSVWFCLSVCYASFANSSWTWTCMWSRRPSDGLHASAASPKASLTTSQRKGVGEAYGTRLWTRKSGCSTVQDRSTTKPPRQRRFEIRKTPPRTPAKRTLRRLSAVPIGWNVVCQSGTVLKISKDPCPCTTATHGQNFEAMFYLNCAVPESRAPSNSLFSDFEMIFKRNLQYLWSYGHEPGCPSSSSSWLFSSAKICKWPTHWNQDLISTKFLNRVDKSFPSVTPQWPPEIVLVPHSNWIAAGLFMTRPLCSLPILGVEGPVKGVNEAVQVYKIFHQILQSFITLTIHHLGQWPW